MIRDVELDVATILEASVASPTLELATNLYAGAFPTSAPDQMVLCRFTGGGGSEEYLGTGQSIFAPEVQVMVRGNRDAYKATLDLAHACFSALHLYQAAEYIKIKPEGAGPNHMGPDGSGRPVFTFQVALSYLAAGAPGAVVPLTQQSAVLAATGSFTGDVQVDGNLNVDGALTVNGEPVSLSDIVFPEYEFDALPFDVEPWTSAIVTDRDNALHVFDGADWRPVLGGNYRTGLAYVGEFGTALNLGTGSIDMDGSPVFYRADDGTSISFNLSRLTELSIGDLYRPIDISGGSGDFQNQPSVRLRSSIELTNDDERIVRYENLETVVGGVDKDGLLEIGILPTASLPPASLRKGAIAYDDTLDQFVFSNGTEWAPVSEDVDLSDIEADIAAVASDLTTHTASTAAHGATGAVVGTTNTQTLSNKTFSTAIVSTVASGAAAVTLAAGAFIRWASGALAGSITGDGTNIGIGGAPGTAKLTVTADSGTYAYRQPANTYFALGSGYIYGDPGGGGINFDTSAKIATLIVPALGNAYLAGQIQNYANGPGGSIDAVRFNAPLKLKNYTVATAPTASHATQGPGTMIYVTNGNAGSPCVAVSNGTDWKVLPLGATISSS